MTEEQKRISCGMGSSTPHYELICGHRRYGCLDGVQHDAGVPRLPPHAIHIQPEPEVAPLVPDVGRREWLTDKPSAINPEALKLSQILGNAICLSFRCLTGVHSSRLDHYG